MSERILKALMHLFAIIAKAEEGSVVSSGRSIVQSFLKQQLSSDLVDNYLKLFDDYLEQYLKISQNTNTTKKRKKTALSSVKVLLICNQINEELTQKQKIVVLIRLIEFMLASGEPTQLELEILTTVTATFNIEEEEYSKIKFFIEKDLEELPELLELLIINNNQYFDKKPIKHIYSEFLDGHIRVLNISSVNMYIIKYIGNDELYLNGQILKKERIYVLTVGSSIRSSKVQSIYYSDIISSFLSDKVETKIVFQANDLEYIFSKNVYGIRNLNIEEYSGRLVGIMGGSGAGKTTLLSIFNGMNPPTSGEILINGYNLYTEKDLLKGVVGYVSQDDLLIEDLTVFENLFYNSKLCFDGYSSEQITTMVNEMLTSLGLFEVKDLKVGTPLNKKISGGQRKRLNIALELIREPNILFVDEPTSGLSSRDSENIMDLLKELTLKGKLVFVVIHQPSSDIFKMFDNLIILDQGGYIVYYGNPVDSITYFKSISHQASNTQGECPNCGNVNPEQIFNIIESKVVDEYGNLTSERRISPTKWNEFYIENKKSKTCKNQKNKRELPHHLFKIPNWIKQVNVFITRDVISKLANRQYILINLLESPLLAFILAYVVKFYNVDVATTEGYVFRENENIPIYIFMCVIVSIFVGLTVSAEEIFKDKKILKREQFLNLSRSGYLMSKISIMFFLSAVQTILFIVIGNTILDIKDMTLDYWIVLFSSAAFANLLGLNISASFNSIVTIYILIPFIVIPQLLLSGAMVKFEKLNPSISHPNKIPIIGEIMTAKWAYEALAVNQFKNNKFENAFYYYDKQMSIADFKKNFWIPRLKAKVDKCEALIDNKSRKKDVINDINILKSEIEKHLIEINLMNHLIGDMFNPLLKFEYVDSLNYSSFSKNVINRTRDYLNLANKFYIELYNLSYRKKDDKIIELQGKFDSQEEFIKIKKQYQNKSLTEYVTNKNEINRVVELDGELFQQVDPIYMDPIHRGNIFSHYYAPQKKFFFGYMDTYWVNIIVIWVMTIFLYITLYYNVFKKILTAIERVFNKIQKIILNRRKD